jgi:hypothetical protein
MALNDEELLIFDFTEGSLSSNDSGDDCDYWGLVIGFSLRDETITFIERI